jgi:penicillin-binding protein 1B
VSPRVAYLVTTLMEGVVERGTARAVRASGIDFPVAGKTGTTNDGRDAWFVGFVPDLLVVTWVGFDREQALGLSGAQAALPIWIDFMKAATAARQPVTFLVPPGVDTVTIDPASGEVATARCPERLDESFFAGEAPTIPCHLHPDVAVPAFAAAVGSPLPAATPAIAVHLGARP